MRQIGQIVLLVDRWIQRDIRCALANATSIRRSGRSRAYDWTVVGADLDGDELHLALIIKDGLLIITVY